MNESQPEPTVRDRIDERPKLDLGKVAKARPRDLLIRFIAGALVSIVYVVLWWR